LDRLDHLTSVGANTSAIDQAQIALDDAKAEYAALSGGESIPGFEQPYEIGDTGPAGGIVFYLDESQLHGLEAAPADVDLNGAVAGGASFEWGCYGTALTGADGTAIGTGEQNTADILAGCATANIAAQVAAQYVWPNGQTDGFLRSKDELNTLYAQKTVVGRFTNSYFWSSSEYPAYFAWFQSFSNGSQNFNPKFITMRVRAVWAF
jgi:hypothetical protein